MRAVVLRKRGAEAQRRGNFPNQVLILQVKISQQRVEEGATSLIKKIDLWLYARINTQDTAGEQ
jgi:hypothetical protein